LTTLEECSTAGNWLGLNDISATSTSTSPRPEGCYYDGLLGLGFSALSQNIGNGADSSRTQLCAIATRLAGWSTARPNFYCSEDENWAAATNATTFPLGDSYNYPSVSLCQAYCESTSGCLTVTYYPSGTYFGRCGLLGRCKRLSTSSSYAHTYVFAGGSPPAPSPLATRSLF
jgi:hypothetical protein